MPIEVGKTKSNDIKLSVDMYKEAQRAKLTFPQFMEKIDPSEDYGPGEKLSAFERQLKRFDIKVKGNEAKGMYASDVESFYLTDDSKVLFPPYIAEVAREAKMADSILPELIAITTPVDASVYLSYHVKDQPEQQTRKRVTEASNLPMCEITGQDQTIKLYKYGRALKFSYEAIRRMKIDMLAMHVRRIGQQAALDKADDAVSVIINGDGNTNPAIVKALHNDLGGVVNTGLDYKSWLKFLMGFYPYNCTTVVGGLNELLSILTMQFPNIDPLVLMATLQQGPVQGRMQLAQGLFANYRVLYLPTAPANSLIAIDKSAAIEAVTEIGSDIMESEKFITNQTNILTVSENNAFAKLFTEATYVLDLAH